MMSTPTQSERLAIIETLLKERSQVAERESERVEEALEDIAKKLARIETDVRDNRAEYDKMVNRGWGILAVVGVAAGAIGALIKTAILDLFK